MNRIRTVTITSLAAAVMAGCAGHSAKKVTGDVAFGVFAAPVLLAALPLAFAIEPFERTSQTSTKTPEAWRERNGYVTLDEAYRAAFGVSASSDAVDQKTGQVLRPAFTRPRDLRTASDLIFTLAARHGMHGDDKVICSEPLQQGGKTYLLLSVVSRKPRKGQQVSAAGFDAWHTPDLATDRVLDWVAIDAALIDQDKYYAYLLAAAAQAMFRLPIPNTADVQFDYSNASRLWRAGRPAEVLDMSDRRGKLLVRLAQTQPTAP